MGTKKIKTDVRKAQVMSAALEIISAKGIEGLTISALAKKTRMTNSNVYRHFRNKDDIIASLILSIGMTLKDIVKNAKHEESDPLKCLEKIFTNHTAFFEKNKNIPRVIFFGQTATDKALIRKHNEHAARYAAQISDLLEEGIKKKSIDRDLDVDSAALAFIGHIQSIALQWMLSGYAFSPRERARKVWKIYLNGIISRKKETL